jgi:hypothetical protein
MPGGRDRVSDRGSGSNQRVARHGSGYRTRPPVTVSVTDEAVAENHGAPVGVSKGARLHPCHLDRSGEIPFTKRGGFVTP